MKSLIVAALAALPLLLVAQQTPSAPDASAIFEHTKAATVIVLAGEGAGRLNSIATGVIVSKDGVILTALHAIKGATEVQVRMANGDVFDRVELLGADERRDVAAIKIAAGALPALSPGSTATLAQGSPVYAVTNANGLTWSATEGILAAIRPADEVPGAGSGFRLLQFTAPVAPGASGGALVDRNGALIGIITGGKGTAAFAVPIENVLGLPDLGPHVALGTGAALKMPAQQAAEIPQSSAAIAGTDPKQLLKNAKTIYIRSKTAFLTVDTLDRALAKQKDWDKLGLTIVQDPRVADLFIEIDRPLFTYVHTFVISDKKTSIVLGSGKVTAFDGTIASGGLAKDIVAIFSGARTPVAAKK
ncbi:MAG: trypsin-like peptidase domain-containing protein [Acidobacteriota bacterium]|nr:trypsin-like peptidase domain-containing protein [Acidobacteriota bacterium]